MYFANCDVILIFRDACRHRPVKVIISCGGHWSVSQNGRSIELAARAQTKVVVVIVVRIATSCKRKELHLELACLVHLNLMILTRKTMNARIVNDMASAMPAFFSTSMPS